MSQENVETIAPLYDEFLAKPDRLTSPELVAFFDPAVEVHHSESLLGTQGTFHGHGGLGRAAREMFDAFSGVPRDRQGGRREDRRDRRPRLDAQRRSDRRLARLPGPGRSPRGDGDRRE
jgi:hypothetical protein